MAVRAAHENVLNATELRTQSWWAGEVSVMCILPPHLSGEMRWHNCGLEPAWDLGQ